MATEQEEAIEFVKSVKEKGKLPIDHIPMNYLLAEILYTLRRIEEKLNQHER